MMEMKIKDFCTFLPKSKIKAGDGLENGKYIFFTSSDIKTLKLNNYIFDDEVIILGTGGKPSCNYYNGKFAVSTDNFVLKSDKIKIKYLYYFLRNNNLSVLENGFHGAGLKHISKDYVNDILVPIADQNNQTKIINTLDLFNKIINKLKMQLVKYDEIVKSQFIEMFGDPKVNPNGYEIKKISDIFNVGSSKRVFESEWTDSGVPFYRAREIVKLSKDGYVDNELFITEEMYENYKKKYGVPQEDDMMVTGVGTLGICYIVRKEDKFYFKDGNTLWFKNKGLCNVRFIRDQYNTDFVREQIEANANASTVGTYTITNANNTMVLVPPIDLQNEYVSFCEVIDKSKYFGGVMYA